MDEGNMRDSEALGMYNDEEQDTPQTEEQHQMASSYPIMDELLAWFDDWITHVKSTDSIDLDDKSDDAKVVRQLMVNKQLAIKLQSKRGELAGKFSAYKQAMNPEPGDDNE